MKPTVRYDMQPEEAYVAGLNDAHTLVNEQREEEGGEACCSLREVVALSNAMYRIDHHRVAFEGGDFDEQEEG
jgi:hypothetical protein